MAGDGRRCLVSEDALGLDEGGGGKDFGIRRLAARAAAYVLGCGFVWGLRYITSAGNPTDEDSRAVDRGELGAGDVERSPAWRLDALMLRGWDFPVRVGAHPARAATRGTPQKPSRAIFACIGD